MEKDPQTSENSLKENNNDTIAAIATPIGQAGIGIVRISGPLAYDITEKIFRPRHPDRTLKNRRLYLGHIADPSTGDILDEVLVSFMKAPLSYTREDIIEINSHSGYLLLSRILELVIEQGARLARPGEFTLRAFLNGRIDLTQAEAVVDLINSKSERGLALASQQIQGSFKRDIERLRTKVADLLGQAEVVIDFPEEETGVLSLKSSAEKMRDEIIEPIKEMIKAHAKRVWVDGVKTVIVGRVNAGKSSLLNLLLNEQRAIVTSIPGTTRDVIESTITIRGLPLRLMDTAGFGRANDEVERIGIDLTVKKFDEADFLLVVIDQSRPINEDDRRILSRCRGKKALIVVNKTDLPSVLGPEDKMRELSGFPSAEISALTGEGLDDLTGAIVNCVLESDADMTTSNAAPNLRHRQDLTEAVRCFESAEQCLKNKEPMEITALELRSGLDALGEIIGETTTEDILDNIFSRFCLGK